MASKLIERFMHRRNLMYHRCQDWEGSRAFLSQSANGWLILVIQPSQIISQLPQPETEAANLLIDALEGTPH